MHLSVGIKYSRLYSNVGPINSIVIGRRRGKGENLVESSVCLKSGILKGSSWILGSLYHLSTIYTYFFDNEKEVAVFFLLLLL